MTVETETGPVDFDIRTEWWLEADPGELTKIVLDPNLIHLWCPSVFLKSETLDCGQPDGLGMTIKLHTKGWLPHTFFFIAKIVDLVPDRSMVIAVNGDFEGAGTMSVTPQDNGKCRAVLHWRARIRQPYIRPLIHLFHAVFVLNHKWAMRNARSLMQEEVYRRRGKASRFTSAKATFPHNLAFFRRRWHRHPAALADDR
jgi:hypothetical protein